MSETISQLPPATRANATDLIPATQGSIGPGTGTSRAVTPPQIMAVPFPGTLTFNHPSVTDVAAPLTGYQIQQDLTYNLSATCTGIYFGNEYNSTINGNPLNVQVWNNFMRMFAETASTSTASMVNHYVQTVRPPGFGAAGSFIWGTVIEARDQTNLVSSQAGGIHALEIDMSANLADDAGNRNALVIALGPGASGSANDMAAKYAIYVTNGPAASGGFYTLMNFASGFRDAGIDFRSAGAMPGSTNHAIWLRTSQNMAFDTAGNDYIFSDGSILRSSVIFNSDSGFSIGGSGNKLSADSQTFTTSIPFRVPGYTVAALPVLDASHHGGLAFATNARNVTEGPGAGTGCLACVGSTGVWLAVWSGVALTT